MLGCTKESIRPLRFVLVRMEGIQGIYTLKGTPAKEIYEYSATGNECKVEGNSGHEKQHMRTD